jgi:hypothetical protein
LSTYIAWGKNILTQKNMIAKVKEKCYVIESENIFPPFYSLYIIEQI